MKTKDKILDIATNLFNQQGTGAVSTNHIAEAAGISPGNLYYHFGNKEEIIRAVFERLYTVWDTVFALPDDRLPILADIEILVRANFKVMWNFRFVYREILALCRHDSILHARYIHVRQRGYEGFRELITTLVEGGVLHGLEDDNTVLRLADLCWLISEFWLPTVEINGETIHTEQIQRGIDLMLHILRPYIRP